MNVQLKKGVLDLCVLSLLSQRDMYGYELVTAVSKGIEISEGTIYPLLKRIKDEGYVTTYLVESPEGPSRKYYAITGAGLSVTTDLEREWRKVVDGVEKVLRGEYL
ncbi:MAG: PadR family transcriptional regulator [Clostridiales bacterium]|jgi:PadR family transcriptional regulator PadR|nr:PadR family transcriptional regulator [Clostridiales bacterium]